MLSVPMFTGEKRDERVPLERSAVECAHVRGIVDSSGRADVVAVAQTLTEQIRRCPR
jgi:hypothetical protein